MNIKQLEPHRAQLFDSFWESFISQLPTKHLQRRWVQKKADMEGVFKYAFNLGGQTVLDMLEDAMKNRPRIITSTSIDNSLAIVRRQQDRRRG